MKEEFEREFREIDSITNDTDEYVFKLTGWVDRVINHYANLDPHAKMLPLEGRNLLDLLDASLAQHGVDGTFFTEENVRRLRRRFLGDVE